MIYTAEVVKAPYPDDSVTDSTENAKYIDVLLHPEGYIIRRVQLPRVISNQVQPSVGSLVLIFRQDTYTAKMISVIKDPVNNSNVLVKPLRGEDTDGSSNFKPGEIQKESTGGAFLNLNNQGSAKLSAADCSEQFVADVGSQAAYVKGINVVLTNRNTLDIRLDKSGDLTIRQTTPAPASIEIASIKIAQSGNIEISTTRDISITGSTIKLKGLAGITKKLITEAFLSVFKSHQHQAGVLVSSTGPVTGVTGTPVAPVIDVDNTTSTTEAE